MRRLAIPPARWLSDCRKWHVDSARRQTLQKKAACTRLPRGEEGAQPTDLAKTRRINFTSSLRTGLVQPRWEPTPSWRAETLLLFSSRSLHAEFRLDSVWLSPVWWIYPDFTSNIPPRSHNGLPLTPINSVWDGCNKVLQMFGITDTDSALPRGYATDIWCWKVAICTLKRSIYLSGIYPRLHLCKLSGKHFGMLTWASLSEKWHGWLDS